MFRADFPRARVLLQPQGDHIELHQKRHGKRLDHEECKRKREARELIGAKGKRFAKKRYAEKAQMKKTNLKMHDESNKRQKVDDDVQEGALPPYLLDRDQTQRAKVLSNTIKQKRKEKAGKWDVPLPKVRPVAEEEMFTVLRTGKRKTKQWKRMVTKATFVGAGFTRKPPKYERFIRPTGLRFTKAHVTHPELKCTFNLDIISVKKNPNGPMYTSLGVMTRGTIIEVNVSELGLVTLAGKVVWSMILFPPGKHSILCYVGAVQANDRALVVDDLISTTLRAIERYRVTLLPTAPPVLVAMIKSEEAHHCDLSSLLFIGIGGAPLSREVAERFAAIFLNIELIQPSVEICIFEEAEEIVRSAYLSLTLLIRCVPVFSAFAIGYSQGSRCCGFCCHVLEGCCDCGGWSGGRDGQSSTELIFITGKTGPKGSFPVILKSG
ncbi:Ribosome biogenesis protein NSA2 [Zea mays]|uniref:Ribosome biogenesis protein NSA2 homolog n=1 Tax=Zea mays TaxID=4577 RepID=A0A3L6F8F1_MAIZE|nr:Ribosome biogenesis protein NSA2 [Zea mays]